MRQFVCAAPLEKNGTIVLEKKDFHYLRNVLRLRVGDMVNVSVQGVQLNMTLCKIDDAAKKMVLQKCAESQGAAQEGLFQNACEFCAKYYLFQFVPKPQKMELIVRQATECGVSVIVPILGEYTQGGTEKSLQNAARYERIIREARQQSGSAVETKILPARSLTAAIEFWRGETQGFLQEEIASLVLYERGENTVPFKNAVFAANTEVGNNAADGNMKNRAAKIRMCALAVGSEGGISPAEFETLLGAGFKAVHFNTNILRCETAALYGIAAIQCAVENQNDF